ncbi:type II secretion system protein [Planctomycetota bacterium]
MTRKTGFTLIELLMVVMIIVVLIALLVPVLRAAREHGRRVVCLGNLRNLQVAWHAYANDYSGDLVYCRSWQPTYGIPRGKKPWLFGFALPKQPVDLSMKTPWANIVKQGALWPYVGKLEIYGCPATPKQLRITTDVQTTGDTKNAVIPIRVSYSIAISTGTDRPLEEFTILPEPHEGGGSPLYVSNIQRFKNSPAGSRMVFVCEGDLRVAYSVAFQEPRWHSPPPIYHSEGTSYAFADGHSEYYKWADSRSQKTGELARDDFAHYIEARDGDVAFSPGNEDLVWVQKRVWGKLGYDPN